MAVRTTIDEILAQAQERIDRYTPAEAHSAASGGAIIIDTRCEEDRRREGQIAGAVHIPRTLLEWRCDPDSQTADSQLADLDRRLIVVCNDGYSSSLAASSLQDLGFRHAGDLVGGFRAWAAEGMPIDDAEEPA